MEPQLFEGRKEGYIWLKDQKSGNEFLCPSHSIKDVKNPREEDLGECVDELSFGGVNPRGG